MPTAYDTFNYSQELQRPAEILAQIGQQRLAIEAAKGDRAAQAEIYKLQLQNTAARDAQRQKDELDQIQEREKARAASVMNASRTDLETAYMVAYPDTTPDELSKKSRSQLITGTQKHVDEKLRDSALGIDQSIEKESTIFEALLSAQSAADQLKIKERVSQNPTFLAYVEKHVHPSWIGFGGKGKQFAADFASGKATLSDLVKESKSPAALMASYAAAVEEVSTGMKDKNGQPVIPPGTFLKLQRHITQIENLSKLRQNYVSQIQDPKTQIEALGNSGSTTDLPAAGFRDESLGLQLPGAPAAPAAAPEAEPSQGAPPTGVKPSTLLPPLTGVPTALSPDYRQAMGQPPLAIPSNPAGFRPATEPGVPLIYGAGGPMSASQFTNSILPAGSRSYGLGQSQPPGALPSTNELLYGGLPNRPAQPTQAAPGDVQPQTPAVNPQDPFVAQRQVAAMQQQLGTSDVNVLKQAKSLAMSEGVDQATIDTMVKAAFSGDPTARQRIQQYVQRAQSRAMLTPPPLTGAIAPQ